MTAIEARAIRASGEKNSPRGHVWIQSALVPFVCEGLDPWSRGAYARDHRDIRRGEQFLKKLWIVEGQVPTFYVVSRHCVACGYDLESAVYDPASSSPRPSMSEPARLTREERIVRAWFENRSERSDFRSLTDFARFVFSPAARFIEPRREWIRTR